MKCQQPGCTGTIVDGYCDVCGMAPADGAPRRVAGRDLSAPSSTSGVADGSACQQPGCSGTIVDGYCDVCGTPAGTPAADSAAVFQGALDEASAATGSFRLQSAAIGSQRAVGTGCDPPRPLGVAAAEVGAARRGPDHDPAHPAGRRRPRSS